MSNEAHNPLYSSIFACSLSKPSRIVFSCCAFITAPDGHVNWVTVEALQSLDTVDGIIKGLPRAAQMLDGRWGDDSAASAVEAAGGLPAWVNRPWVWRFNGVYCEFSNTNNFSRTWLMVTLANVLQALEDEQRKLTVAEHQQPRPTYDKLEAAYQTWRTLAEKHARKPTMAQVREMETGLKDVRPRKRHAEVKQMLDALLETLKSADV